jgi:hypothetical protein
VGAVVSDIYTDRLGNPEGASRLCFTTSAPRFLRKEIIMDGDMNGMIDDFIEGDIKRMEEEQKEELQIRRRKQNQIEQLLVLLCDQNTPRARKQVARRLSRLLA